MNYEESLEWLYHQLPYFSRIGAAAYKKDITNTVLLCDLLNNPQQRFKSIHIAGTNGKGSTSHMLAAIFQKAGYKTGLYTSPHIQDFRERIRINGKMIAPSFVQAFVNQMKTSCEQIQPSFFELTVAMAFSYFAQEEVDIAIIETGMGGRLDSTNIIQPELSVITNIGFDHMQFLGNSLDAIASEKAGIIKENTPVVIGQSNDITKAVFVNKAKTTSSTCVFAEALIDIAETQRTISKTTYELKNKQSGESTSITTDLNGAYQINNIRTVIAALDILKKNGWNISPKHIQEGLHDVKTITGLLGRWDVISESPVTIADVGHNEDGIKEIISQLSQQYPNRNYHFIVGFVADKDISKILALFPKEASYYFTQANIPRALDKQQLELQANAFGLIGCIYEDVNEALADAKRFAKQEDIIIICGSFFLLAELNHYLADEINK